MVSTSTSTPLPQHLIGRWPYVLRRRRRTVASSRRGESLFRVTDKMVASRPQVGLLLLILGALLAGLVLLIVGMRGRLADTDPHCRRCRFNLRGRDETALDPRCPE